MLLLESYTIYSILRWGMLHTHFLCHTHVSFTDSHTQVHKVYTRTRPISKRIHIRAPPAGRGRAEYVGHPCVTVRLGGTRRRGARVVTPRQRMVCSMVELRRPVAPFALCARGGVGVVQRAGGRGWAASRVGEAKGERRGACAEEADSGAQLEDAARTWLG